jgi:hypothetical protein
MVKRAGPGQKTTVGRCRAWWKAFGQRMAELQARAVLTICYFVVIPPFAALLRWTSDPLAIRPRTARGWRDRPHPPEQSPPGTRLERARRQY